MEHAVQAREDHGSGDVAAGLATLQEAFGRLAHQTERLEKTLHPVLVPTDEVKPTLLRETGPGPMSPMGYQLHELAHDANALADRLSTLVHRSAL